MTSRDGELICPQCKTLLNTSDRLCWRCGGTNLQPGPKPKPVPTEDMLIDFVKQVRDNPQPPVSLKWPVDANGTPLPADPNASCVCTPYYKCAYHAEKDAGVNLGNTAIKSNASFQCRHGVSISAPCAVCDLSGKPSPFGVDPAWVESVRKGSIRCVVGGIEFSFDRGPCSKCGKEPAPDWYTIQWSEGSGPLDNEPRLFFACGHPQRWGSRLYV